MIIQKKNTEVFVRGHINNQKDGTDITKQITGDINVENDKEAKSASFSVLLDESKGQDIDWLSFGYNVKIFVTDENNYSKIEFGGEIMEVNTRFVPNGTGGFHTFLDIDCVGHEFKLSRFLFEDEINLSPENVIHLGDLITKEIYNKFLQPLGVRIGTIHQGGVVNDNGIDIITIDDLQPDSWKYKKLDDIMEMCIRQSQPRGVYRWYISNEGLFYFIRDNIKNPEFQPIIHDEPERIIIPNEVLLEGISYNNNWKDYRNRQIVIGREAIEENIHDENLTDDGQIIVKVNKEDEIQKMAERYGGGSGVVAELVENDGIYFLKQANDLADDLLEEFGHMQEYFTFSSYYYKWFNVGDKVFVDFPMLPGWTSVQPVEYNVTTKSVEITNSYDSDTLTNNSLVKYNYQLTRFTSGLYQTTLMDYFKKGITNVVAKTVEKSGELFIHFNFTDSTKITVGNPPLNFLSTVTNLIDDKVYPWVGGSVPTSEEGIHYNKLFMGSFDSYIIQPIDYDEVPGVDSMMLSTVGKTIIIVMKGDKTAEDFWDSQQKEVVYTLPIRQLTPYAGKNYGNFDSSSQLYGTSDGGFGSFHDVHPDYKLFINGIDGNTYSGTIYDSNIKVIALKSDQFSMTPNLAYLVDKWQDSMGRMRTYGSGIYKEVMISSQVLSDEEVIRISRELLDKYK